MNRFTSFLLTACSVLMAARAVHAAKIQVEKDVYCKGDEIEIRFNGRVLPIEEFEAPF